MKSSKTRQIVIATAAAIPLALAVCFGGSATAHQGRGQLMHEGSSAAPADPSYVPPAPETLGGPFELVDHNGRKVTDATFRGQWVVLFFGFAGCREACPIGLESITQAMQHLGDASARVQPLFVDLDFAGPDLTGLAQFVGHFHRKLLGLTGNRRQMYSMLRNYQVRREIKHAAQGAKETGPRIDHTAYIYVVDPVGKTRSYFHHSLSPAEMAAHIKRYF